ncbi:MAG: hypothetical protein MAG453_01725 [Calditrichaeota bacterium]|nr:hypothetical protein [Calditrichota bacterium]
MTPFGSSPWTSVGDRPPLISVRTAWFSPLSGPARRCVLYSRSEAGWPVDSASGLASLPLTLVKDNPTVRQPTGTGDSASGLMPGRAHFTDTTEMDEDR